MSSTGKADHQAPAEPRYIREDSTEYRELWSKYVWEDEKWKKLPNDELKRGYGLWLKRNGIAVSGSASGAIEPKSGDYGNFNTLRLRDDQSLFYAYLRYSIIGGIVVLGAASALYGSVALALATLYWLWAGLGLSKVINFRYDGLTKVEIIASIWVSTLFLMAMCYTLSKIFHYELVLPWLASL